MYPALLLVLVVSVAALDLIGRYRRAMRAARDELYKAGSRRNSRCDAPRATSGCLPTPERSTQWIQPALTMEHQRQLGEQAVKHDQQA